MTKHFAPVFFAFLAFTLVACSEKTGQSDSGDPPSLLTLTQDQQLDVYRHIEDSYDVREVKRGTTVHPLPEAGQMINPAITWNDTNYTDITTFMEDTRISGILVLKDGEILLEDYALGRQPEDRWTSFSVAKSLTSLLLGAAIQDGYIESLDDPVTKYVPNLQGSGYDGVNIRQLITMTSGVQWNEDYDDENSDVARSSYWPGEPGMNPLVSYMRRLPGEAEPGTRFVYKTGETDMAGILVAKATGKGLAQYLSEKIWEPYGMEQDAIWMVDRGGMERGGCCISMTLRDYARVGQFVLDGGEANGQPVVPAQYLTEATTNQVDFPEREGGYGYFWWINEDGSYSARGIFGQRIHIIPEEDVVIAINSATAEALSYNEPHTALLEAIQQTIAGKASP